MLACAMLMACAGKRQRMFKTMPGEKEILEKTDYLSKKVEEVCSEFHLP